MNLSEFRTTYVDRATRQVIDVELNGDGEHPMVVVTHGRYTVVLNLMGLSDHLCVDVHPFVDGEKARAGVFGMEEGRRSGLRDGGGTSHGHIAARLVAVLVGEQAPQPTARS